MLQIEGLDSKPSDFAQTLSFVEGSEGLGKRFFGKGVPVMKCHEARGHGSVRIRFVHGTVRAVPVIGSDGFL